MSKRAVAVAGLALTLSSPINALAVKELPEAATGLRGTADVSAAKSVESTTKRFARIATKLVDSVSLSMSERFVWPVEGAINTPFGGDHDGIDIEGETGDPIVAARSGRVVFAGDDGDGYGNKIVIAHGRGISSLYSHLSTMKVRRGWVDRGAVIGRVGCTGSCSGDHLHFEILENKKATSPLRFLPETSR